MEILQTAKKNIFLTDDDVDDCLIFSEAVQEMYSNIELDVTIYNDGEQLMQSLKKAVLRAPEVIFLDLNMPRKNGFECLDEIRNDPKLRDIPIVIFSTSLNNDLVNKTYERGANYYICKPHSYSVLKKTINTVLSFNSNQLQQPQREQFVINVA